VNPVHLIVYSDYLCPWCFNVSVRMQRLRQECGETVRIEWRSFLLRPRPAPTRDLERFRRYTQSWMRPAGEEDAGTFRVWEGDAGPPSHSIPPHQVAKAAATLGEEAFERIHDSLLHSYFAQNRDITAAGELRDIWAKADLPPAEFARSEDPDLLQQILREHQEALDFGASGAPAIRRADQDLAITGAYPLEFYRRWIRKALEESSA
jgi:predicted DsbA family dithiol-disulfide isomerase